MDLRTSQEADKVVGLYFQRSKGIDAAEYRKELKKQIEEFVYQEDNVNFDEPFIKLTMPCGKSLSYQNFEDIPQVDTPCPCGNPKHWLVKYDVESGTGEASR